MTFYEFITNNHWNMLDVYINEKCESWYFVDDAFTHSFADFVDAYRDTEILKVVYDDIADYHTIIFATPETKFKEAIDDFFNKDGERVVDCEIWFSESMMMHFAIVTVISENHVVYQFNCTFKDNVFTSKLQWVK